MTEQLGGAGGPGWARSDSAGPSAPSGPSDPPPPPWQPPPPGGQQPPPPGHQPPKRRRDRLVVLAVAAAALVLGIPIGLAAYSALSELDGIDLTRDSAAPRDDDGGDGGSGGGGFGEDIPEVPRVDLDELSGEDAVFGQLLTDIDRAELTMIDTQVQIAEAFADAAPEGGDPEDVTEEISSAAGAGQRELQEIRRDLAAPVDGEVARDLRDTYLSHLDAWVRYLVAVEETPGILVSRDADSAFMLAINTTGDAFAKVIRDGLPNGLDQGVREMADAIVDRGFPERDLADGDTV